MRFGILGVSAPRLIALLCALWLLPAAAWAHEPPRIFDAIWDDQGDPRVLLMNRGMLFRDGAGSYRFMCNEALSINTAERVGMFERPDGVVMMFTSAGLQSSSDGGCSWQQHASFEGWALKGFAVHPSDPQTLFTTTATNAADNGVHRSLDSGESWTKIHDNRPGEVFTRLLTSEADPNRLYASGLSLSDAAFIHFVARSEDGGESFERHDLVLQDDEHELRVLATDPSDADTVYAVADSESGPEPKDRLLVSRDGGRSFSSLIELLELLALDVSSDGTQLLVGAKEGLWRSRDGGQSFEQVSPDTHWIASLLRSGDTLHAGAIIAEGHEGLGRSGDEGDSFAAVLDFSQVDRRVQCPADSPELESCDRLWDDWRFEIHGLDENGNPLGGTMDGGLQADAGVAPGAAATGGIGASGAAGSGSDAGELEGPESSGGCNLAARGGQGANLAPLWLSALALAIRRRARG